MVVLTNFLGSTNAIKLEKLFTQPNVSIDDVLSRNELANYLRVQMEQQTPNKTAIGYVERNIGKIVAAVAKTGISVTPTPAGNAAESRSGKQSSNSTPRDDASVNNGSLTSVDGNFSGSNISIAATMSIENATELLIFYIKCSEAANRIDKIVPPIVSFLGRKGVLHPCVAQSVQRILVTAFDEDWAKTTEMITVRLDEEIIHGVIRNISNSSVIGETLIAIFGSALTVVKMIDPATKTHTFTESWVQMRFPQHLASYVTVAMSTSDNHPYFFFLRELLRRGFSHTAGPVVDVLLSKNVINGVIADIVSACERTDGGEDNFPLASDAVAVLVSIFGQLRKSLIPPETREMYASNLSLISPIQCLIKHSKQLCQLLKKDKIMEKAVAPFGLGACRFGICELFAELLNYNMYDTDMMIMETGFLDSLAETCARFPHHDCVARLLLRCFLMIFERHVMNRETAEDTLQNDVIVKYLAQREKQSGLGSASSSSTDFDDDASAKDTSSSSVGTAEKAKKEDEKSKKDAASQGKPGDKTLFTYLDEFCSSPTYKNTSLQAFALETISKLSELPLFSPTSMIDSPFKGIVSRILQNEDVQRRRRDMNASISGDGFDQPMSGCREAIRHHPSLNFTGAQLEEDLPAVDGLALDGMSYLPESNKSETGRMYDAEKDDEEDVPAYVSVYSKTVREDEEDEEDDEAAGRIGTAPDDAFDARHIVYDEEEQANDDSAEEHVAQEGTGAMHSDPSNLVSGRNSGKNNKGSKGDAQEQQSKAASGEESEIAADESSEGGERRYSGDLSSLSAEYRKVKNMKLPHFSQIEDARRSSIEEEMGEEGPSEDKAAVDTHNTTNDSDRTPSPVPKGSEESGSEHDDDDDDTAESISPISAEHNDERVAAGSDPVEDEILPHGSDEKLHYDGDEENETTKAIDDILGTSDANTQGQEDVQIQQERNTVDSQEVGDAVGNQNTSVESADENWMHDAIAEVDKALSGLDEENSTAHTDASTVSAAEHEPAQTNELATEQ